MADTPRRVTLVGDPPTEPTEPVIPEADRPSPSPSADSSGAADDASDADRHPSGRKVRSDKGRPKGGAASHKRGAAAETRARAAAGATMLYGGLGMLLQLGPAPAAGVSMVGLADEAGEPLAEWARRRSPRFYQFLSGLSETVGAGKYVGAPVVAELYARSGDRMRGALQPPLIAALGEDGAQQIHSIGEMYDQARAQAAAAAAEANGAGPFPMPPPPTPGEA